MSSLLYTLEGWPNSPASDNVARSFNNDTLIWSTAIATTPFTGQVVTTETTIREKGGWDGNYWYVIGPDGKLYRYNPSGNTWSAALVGGTVIVSGTVEQQSWTMTCDGRFLYILDSGAGFRRYDPAADTLTALSAIPGNAYSGKMLLNYDGNDTLYGYKGGTDATAQLAAYTISANTWTVLTNQATISSDLTGNLPTWSAFLQGKWWLFYYASGTSKVWQYDPAGPTWTAKTSLVATLSGINYGCPFGEMTDATIRLWPTSLSDSTLDYNVGIDTWTRGPNPPVGFNQGCNWAVTRLFQPIFTWYEADGTTLTANTESLGTLTQGDTTTQHFKVKSVQAHAGGATVNVAASFTTDAEDPATICQTPTGTFATSFTTAALNAGDIFDVYVKLAPTVSQTPGLAKIFNLRAVGN